MKRNKDYHLAVVEFLGTQLSQFYGWYRVNIWGVVLKIKFKL